MTVERKVQWWLKVDDPSQYVPERFPVFITDSEFGEIYGLPVYVLPGLKIANHTGGLQTDPDHVNRTVAEDESQDVVRFASWFLDGVRQTFCRAWCVCIRARRMATLLSIVILVAECDHRRRVFRSWIQVCAGDWRASGCSGSRSRHIAAKPVPSRPFCGFVIAGRGLVSTMLRLWADPRGPKSWITGLDRGVVKTALQIRIRAADQFQIQPVRIFHENVADGVAPLDEFGVAREDAAVVFFDFGKQLTDVADTKRHAAGIGVGHAEIERFARHAFDLDHLDARVAAGDESAGHAIGRTFRQSHQVEHRGVAGESFVRLELEAEDAVPVFQSLVCILERSAP